MAPSPKFQIARLVVGLAASTLRKPDQDEAFIRAVRNEFPNVANYQRLPNETPSQVPYLFLQSTAARLALAGGTAQIDIAFYGDYVGDLDKSLDYVARKLRALLDGFRAIESVPSFLGLVFTTNYSFKDTEGEPAQYLLGNHLRVDQADNEIQDAMFRVGLRIADRYYLSLQMINYETKSLERPFFGGPSLEVKAWEGVIEDTGVQVLVDINNRLAAVTQKIDPVLDDQMVISMLELSRFAISEVTPELLFKARLPSQIALTEKLPK